MTVDEIYGVTSNARNTIIVNAPVNHKDESEVAALNQNDGKKLKRPNSTLIKYNSIVGNLFLNSCHGVSLTVPLANQKGQLDGISSNTSQTHGKNCDNVFNAIKIAAITVTSTFELSVNHILTTYISITNH